MKTNQMFLYFFIIFFIFASAERLWRTFISYKQKTSGQIKAKWTSSALVITHFIIYMGMIAEYFVMQREINFTVTALGLFMFITSFVIRNWCSKTLGEFRTIHIEIREKQRLIKEGPYRYLRHPWYSAIMLEVLSLPLIPNAYYTFLIAILIYIPLLLIRVRIEEEALIEKFGGEYLEYKKEVAAFVPIKKCLRCTK